MNKKIGFLIMNIENGGGTERVTSVITNELVERGYEITIISCQHGNCCKFTLNKKINRHSLAGEKCGNSFFRKLYVEKQLVKYVKENHIDVMIAVDVALYLYLIPLHLIHLSVRLLYLLK